MKAARRVLTQSCSMRATMYLNSTRQHKSSVGLQARSVIKGQSFFQGLCSLVVNPGLWLMDMVWGQRRGQGGLEPPYPLSRPSGLGRSCCLSNICATLPHFSSDGLLNSCFGCAVGQMHHLKCDQSKISNRMAHAEGLCSCPVLGSL